jgi:hypothetical protein
VSRGTGPSLPIDVRIPGVGRVKKRSGVYSRAERDDLVAMLRLLPKQGHGALVEDIQAGRRELLDVYRHYVENTLTDLAGPQQDQPLAPLLEPWLDTAQCADGTRDNRRDAFRALRPDGRRTYRLSELPDLLQAYRERCEQAETPRVFNIAKTAVQAFVRDKVGKRKPLTLAVADVPGLPERGQGRPGVVLADAIAIREQLSPPAARCWWSMCLTGMGPKEFWVDGWTVDADRVRIRGEKAFGRLREVPLVDSPVRPEITRDGFTSALRRLSEKRLVHQLTEQLEREPTADELAAAAAVDGPWKVTPYQARKTFSRWMEDARIPRARREIYRGHSNRDVGDLYERYEITTYLREDAQAMRALLPQQGLRMVP